MYTWGNTGGYFRNFRVGMCRWDPGTLSLNQSSFKWILLHYTKLNSQNPPPILEYLFSRNYWGQKHSPAKTKPIWFLMFLIGNSRFPWFRLKSSINWSVSWKMIPYSRLIYPIPEYQTLHSGTYLDRPYMVVPPRGRYGKWTFRILLGDTPTAM